MSTTKAPALSSKQLDDICKRFQWSQVLDALAALGMIRCTTTGGQLQGIASRILLAGPPGTGKSSWPQYRYGDAEVIRVPLHSKMPVDDLIGGMGLSNGNTVCVPQHASKAMKEGKILVLDEIDQHSPLVRCALHGILDAPEIARVCLPDGQVIRPAAGFAVVATTNAQPSSLPEALLDRFDVVLIADKPAEGLYATMPKDYGKLVANHYERLSVPKWTAPMSVRAMLAVSRIEAACGHLGFASRCRMGESHEGTSSALVMQRK